MIPTICRPWARYFFCIWAKSGNSLRHGMQYDAQKFTISGLPEVVGEPHPARSRGAAARSKLGALVPGTAMPAVDASAGVSPESAFGDFPVVGLEHRHHGDHDEDEHPDEGEGADAASGAARQKERTRVSTAMAANNRAR